jgi:hypothetical protein
MIFWHGGNLNDYDQPMKHKKGRHEYGPGLYATTHYDTAKKYAKGSRKLYLLEIEKGNELTKSTLPFEVAEKFINSNVTKSKRNEVLERLSKYNKNNQVPANIFSNIILNSDALKSSKMNLLREFLVNNGIDYEMVNSPFGWNEIMIVLYNISKISNVKQVTPKDKIKIYDIEDINKGVDSIIASNRTSKIARTLYIAESLDQEYMGQHTASAKLPYLGQCDKLRRKDGGEEYWQEMMSNKKEVDIEEFEDNTDFKAILDEDEETTEGFTSDDPDSKAYKSEWNKKPAYFLQTAGFEFIFANQ